MALSFFTESDAPRDFRISSTDSDGHYTKCPLCYTIKKNFYCVDCIKAGNFVNSSLPYTDRFAEKQLKLSRLKANRKYVQERCEAILRHKSRRDRLETDIKQYRDRIHLLRLAIDQKQNNIEYNRNELDALSKYNTELRLKLPRYQKKVALLGKHAHKQRTDLQNKTSDYEEKAESLAELRRARIRQLINYIFPVYISYDTSESVEEMEFLKVESDNEPLKRVRLHIVGPWLPADSDFSNLHHWMTQSREAATSLESEVRESPVPRTHAALCFAAQLISLLAWSLDMRLPYAINFRDWCTWRLPGGAPARGGVEWRARRLRACAASVCARGGQRPPPHALVALHTLAVAAATADPALGRPEPWRAAAAHAHAPPPPPRRRHSDSDTDSDDEPEHLHWPDHHRMEELERSPPMPSPSLVTSAAASIASLWRGWTK